MIIYFLHIYVVKQYMDIELMSLFNNFNRRLKNISAMVGILYNIVPIYSMTVNIWEFYKIISIG